MEGFQEWKREQIARTVVAGLLPRAEPEDMGDFVLPKELEHEHQIVSGYYALLRSVTDVRECSFYFRRYPFRNMPVTREAHLRTCCELFFSRVYQFEQRWQRLLKWLNRRTKPKNSLALAEFEELFRDRFKDQLSIRHRIHHEESYDDPHLRAFGIGDLLSSTDPDLAFLRVSNGNYRYIANEWKKRVELTADQLNLFVGLTAMLMLNRCKFLLPAPRS